MSYPDHVPATVGELRQLLAGGGRVRCDGLLDELLGEPARAGQLVTVSGQVYRVGGDPDTGARWLDPRPHSPILTEMYPYKPPQPS